LLAAGFAAAMPGPRVAAADEQFRVENRVFLGNERAPQTRTTTIFYQGVVYDYLDDPAEVTVFDKAHGRFVLLNLDQRVKAELTTQQVEDFTNRLKQWTQDQSDPFLRFLGRPQFEDEFDESAGRWVFASRWVTYRVTAVDTQDEETSRQYREFSDWYCRLNTLLNPGARPPFARMLVNAALEQRGQIPREVQVTLRPKEMLLAKRITARSEHLLVRHLVESDRKRVAQTDQFMAMFSTVDFAEYQRKLGN
jgi:hypothetical protein